MVYLAGHARRPTLDAMASSPRHLRADPRAGRRPFLASLVVAALTCVGGAAGAVVTGSWALAAVAVHGGADLLHHLLLLQAGRRAERLGADDHPASYQRHRAYWAFALGLGIYAVGAAAAIVVGLRAVDDPAALEQPEVAAGILAAALVLRFVVLRAAARSVDDHRGEAGRWRYVRRAPTPQLPLAVVEGVAAVIGLLVAAAGVAAVELADEPTADGWAAVGVGGVLAVVALALVGLLKTLVVGSAASSRSREAALAAIEVDPDTVEVEHLQVERLGPDELLIAARVRFQPQLSLVEVAGAIARVERAIRTGIPAARAVYLEPAVDLDERASTFVEERVGHIDPDDPDYADITGTHRLDDLWS